MKKKEYVWLTRLLPEDIKERHKILSQSIVLLFTLPHICRNRTINDQCTLSISDHKFVM